jgi:hypothetical protein
MTGSPALQLSVVVAAQDSGDLLRRCLLALTPQLPKSQMEILVVMGDGAPQPAFLREFPQVRALAISRPWNVPRMWTRGIAAAQGAIVALTIENCIPAQDWAAKTLAAHANPWTGIGGAIEPDESLSLGDWAVYFCRYSNYMLPFAARFVEDFAADNCSYEREAVQHVTGTDARGFWETLAHREMRRRDEKLYCDPVLVMRFAGGISTGTFLARRYRHGRYFAARRSERFTTSQRLIRALGAPVVPLVLLRRISGRVFAKGRHQGKFLVCLPLIACFLLAWAAGEAMGYLAGYPAAGPPD